MNELKYMLSESFALAEVHQFPRFSKGRRRKLGIQLRDLQDSKVYLGKRSEVSLELKYLHHQRSSHKWKTRFRIQVLELSWGLADSIAKS